jgi:phosphoenolpyruvate synthase/pyruvate phosphate dikinase
MTAGNKITSNEFVKWFSKLNSKDILEVGEKGANLGELFNLKIPVPNGFVVTTKAYDEFLEKSKIKDKIQSFLGQIDINNSEQLENYISSIRSLILKAEFPEELKEEILDSYENLGTNKVEIEKGSAFDILNSAVESVFVAVRSSLPFVDIHKTNNLREQDTYLNVKGNENLLNHIKKCFASLFNVETIKRYLKEKISFDKIKIAVVIQNMIEGEKSGIVYSTNDSSKIYAEAIWGLGEGMNVKDIFPDQYILSKELEILDKKINEKNWGVIRDAGGNLKKIKLSPERSVCPVLADYELQRLGDLSEKIEKHFNFPQEIEFVIGGEIYIVQTRKLDKFVEREEIKFEKSDLVEKVEIQNKEEKISKNIGRVEKVTKTKLKLVVDSLHFLNDCKETGLKKVGFFKIESIIKESGKHPNYFLSRNYVNEYENIIFNGISEVIKNFEEVWMRTSDFKSDEFLGLESSPEKLEKNPLLGLHGIRYGLKHLEILESELRALKKASVGRKVGILIPGIISVEELRKVKELLNKIGFNPKVGIVVETPSAVQLIKDFTEEGIDRILIETNNLIQYLLCIDLGNKELDYLYDDMHPSLMYQLEYVIRVCKRRGIETSISGKALMNNELLKFLVQKEIASICIESDFAKEFSEKIYDFEKELFGGTDKEPRQYELEKTKEEYIEEIPEMEKNIPKTMEDLEILEETEKVVPVLTDAIKKDIEMIEAEKKEYEENGVLEEEKVDLDEQPEEEELIEEEIIDEVKEHPEEEFDENIEKHEDVDSEILVDDIDKAVEIIENEKREYEKSSHKEKERDTLGIF